MWSLAQSYNYTSTSTRSSYLGRILPIYIVLILIFIAAYWKIFEKAGEAGWKAIIPIYNTVTICRLVGLSGWYVLLTLIPVVNIVFIIYLTYLLSKAFGHDIGMTILMLLGVGLLIVGFGDSKYVRPKQVNTSPAE